jgi:hypothetical protein
MVIRSKSLALITMAVVFGGIFSSAWMGIWQTESQKIPVRYQEGAAAGEYNPADIRGSYSFGEISNLFDIPLDVLGRAFRLPADINLADFQNKELETLYADLDEDKEIGTASMRLFVAYYKGLPYTPNEDIYLLKPAVNILKNQAELSPEQIFFLDTHNIDLETPESASAPASAGEKASGTGEEHDEDAQIVRGKTTFTDLLEWGLAEESIQIIIGGEIPNPIMLVRDYCTENGIEFSTIKTELQTEVDKLNE